MLDRMTRPWVLRLSRLEEVKDVFRARCRPKSEEMVIRISEGPTAADCHEARVPELRQDHSWHSFCLHPPNILGCARPGRMRFARGQESVAFIAAVFETGDPRYQWINSIQAAGKGILSPDLRTVEYELFELT
jgi:hypothetical protein